MTRPHPALLDLAAGRAPGVFPHGDDGLVDAANGHGMTGLLWSWVREHAPDAPARVRLAGLDAAVRHRHGRLEAALVRVRDDLAAIGVEVAAIKGVTAEARWYRRRGERPCTDVDVLLEPGAARRLDEILAVLAPGHPLGTDAGALARANVLQSVGARVDGVPVDLHLDLYKLGFPARRPDLVWERTRGHELPDGSSVRVLDPEVALVHFLVHMNKDSFPALLGYADVARVLAREEIDWGFVDRYTRAEGLDIIVAGARARVTAALGLSGPAGPVPSGPRARVWRAVWPERVTLLGSAGTARSRRQEALPFLVRGRLRDALGAAGRVAVPPPAAVAVWYADLPGPYPVRLLRGRVRTMHRRRAALRARITGDPRPAPHCDADATARLLRTRAEQEPLWLDVSGRSMGWSIPSGTRVRIEARATGPARGEVWAFCGPQGEIVVHRHRGAVGARHRFQGDTCVRADPPVAPSALIGRVTAVSPSRPYVRWGPAAGAVQRVPRTTVAGAVRLARRLGAGARR